MVKQRRSDASNRLRTYLLKWSHLVTPGHYKRSLGVTTPLLDEHLVNQDELERRTFTYLTAQGVPTDEWIYYMACGRRAFSMYLTYWDSTAADERASLRAEFILRGYNPVFLDGVLNIAQQVAALVRP